MIQSLDELLLPDELHDLEHRYGAFPRDHVELQVHTRMIRKFAHRKLKTRRAEVLFVLTDPAGRALLHTNESYPDGTWRLPTGGVDWAETAPAALRREVREETSFHVTGERLLGVLSYEFRHGEDTVPFVSFVFHVPCVVGTPRPEDPSEGISGFRWVDSEFLAATADDLRAVEDDRPGRREWGAFRAAGHDFVAHHLAACAAAAPGLRPSSRTA